MSAPPVRLMRYAARQSVISHDTDASAHFPAEHRWGPTLFHHTADVYAELAARIRAMPHRG